MIEIRGKIVRFDNFSAEMQPREATIALSISELVEQLCGCKILPPQSKQGAPEDYVIKVEADNEGNVSSPFFIGVTEIKKLGVYKEYGKIWRVVCEKEEKQDEPLHSKKRTCSQEEMEAWFKEARESLETARRKKDEAIVELFASRVVRNEPPKFDQQSAIAMLDTSWMNRLSAAYGGVYAVAMGNREKINEIIEWLMKGNRKK